MIDQRFFRRAGPFSLERIASHLGGSLSASASADALIDDIAAPEEAGAGHIGIFTDAKYRDACQASKAGALVTSTALAAMLGERPLILTDEPRLAFVRLSALFYPEPALIPAIDPRAAVDPTARIGEGCRIEAGAAIGAGARIGARCHIAHNAVIGDGVEIGDDCTIGPNCSVEHAVLGARVRLKAGTTIGGEGYGFEPSPEGLKRLPQLGRVAIGNDVEIGNNCTIDRGCLCDTVIGDGCKFDNLIHVAHNVKIGKYCVITAQVGIAGSAVIGNGVMIGGQTAIVDHVHVGDGARIVGQSGVMRDVPPGATIAGTPAVPIRDWHRQSVALAKLIAAGRPKPK